MYSPVGMLSWFELFQKYLDAKDNPEKMRSFVNLYLGLPFKETGSRPKLEKVIELRGEYREGEVPDGVLFLTAGIDVQRGTDGDPLNPPRLEMEILGHGAGFRTWSVLYRTFEGETTRSAFEGAWSGLHDWATGGGLILTRSDGFRFPVNLVFIDSGDGMYFDIVYNFASRWQNTYASKGFGALQKRKTEKGDEAGPHNFKRYRAATSGRMGDATFYEISTNFYKTQVYNNLQLARRDVAPQRPGYCDFPRDRNEKYFKMLTAEEKRSDGSFHAGGRRNEALDCRVMALCAADVFLDAKVSGLRVAAKANGATDLELHRINQAFVLDMLAKQSTRRRVA
jgi:phage terminase large subunit GpA-like protein